MGWEKKGLLFSPRGQYPWVMTHGMLPVADRIGEDLYRIYFSGRDVFNRSRIGYIEVDMNEPDKVLHLSEHPVLDLGKLGCFDDNGVTPTWIVTHGGKKYLYYFGWNRGSTVRAAEVSGLAISEDGGLTFQRYSAAPIIDRTNAEPYTILVISCIMIENGIWRMWYDSADRWTNSDVPNYNVKYAESKDGVCWHRAGTVSVDYLYPGESRVSRASVIKESGMYRMWYCYAIGAGGYRMGYCESKDGFRFCRMDDKAGIDMSASGWDSEMICYPYVFDHKGRRMMLYCGNGYGKTGFGYAEFRNEI
ncbi:MAG: glycoside hydrolase family protein [Syntrophales bacterium]